MDLKNVNAMLLFANINLNKKDFLSVIRSLQMAYEVSKNNRYLGEIEIVEK